MKKTLLCLPLLTLLCFTSLAPAAEPTNVKPAAAEKLIQEGKVVVLDVRTGKEFKNGHIEGAQNIDFSQPDFEKQLQALDKSKAYLVHCQAGGRSEASMKFFQKLGFESIYHMDEGYAGWEDAGKPVKR
jgi:rhodanese-related sulfurtransferase